MGDAPDFNDLVRDDPAAAWRTCGRAKAYRPESGNGTGNLPVLDFTLWQGEPIPPRRWLVAQWLPWGHVTSLYGDGGTGKSLLAQQLMTCVATRHAWLGLETTPCRAFGVFAEDDDGELLRRQVDINAHYGLDFRDLGAMRALSRVGEDAVLATFGRNGEIALTDFWRDFREAARAFAAQLLVIDTAADAFGGDENRRGEVRAFLRACLGALARELDATVLLCAHPSRSGLATGEGDGGNTAWSNSVRSRLYLARANGDDERERHDNACTLTRKKSNYAGRGDEIKLTWRAGVFHVDAPPTGVLAGIEKRNAEKAFLEALDQATAAGRNLSDSKNAGNYAPKVLQQMPAGRGFKVRDLERAMGRLFGDGGIRMVPYGPLSNGTRRIERIAR